MGGGRFARHGTGLTFRRIILPQALRVILPPMTNDFVALFKDTSVASVIVVVELTKQYQILSANPENYPNALEIAGTTALALLAHVGAAGPSVAAAGKTVGKGLVGRHLVR